MHYQYIWNPHSILSKQHHDQDSCLGAKKESKDSLVECQESAARYIFELSWFESWGEEDEE